MCEIHMHCLTALFSKMWLLDRTFLHYRIRMVVVFITTYAISS